MNTTEQPKYMVRVSCMTFNHVNYIEDAMNGFTMQDTKFPFICTIIDDASTDGEQEVIKKYLQEHFDLDDKSTVRNEDTDDYKLTFARHKTNRNCYFAVIYLKYNHYSIKKSKDPYIKEWQDTVKYIALCEGDDYWTHPQKLQMQYEVLEAHPKYTISFHRTQVVNADNSIIKGSTIPSKGYLEDKGEVTLLDFCQTQFRRNFSWSFQTSSFFYRVKMINKIQELEKTALRNFPFGDAKIVLTCLSEGNGFLIRDYMSCYRALTGVCVKQRRDTNLRLKVNHKIIEAYKDFDLYTDYKYHKYFKLRTLRAEIECKMIENKWALLNPKYWPITLSRSFLMVFASENIQPMFPTIYSMVRYIYRKAKK